MAGIPDIVSLVDQGLDTNFAASIAGLSLAAVAFFAPAATTTAQNHKQRIDELDDLIDKAESKGYTTETELTKERDRLQTSIDQILIAQNSLLKAFLIFVGFVAYSITIDQALNTDTSSSLAALVLGIQNGLSIQILEVFVSVALLSVGGWNLWKGARGIGDYFNVSFVEEIEHIQELKSALADSLKRINKRLR